MFKDKWGGGTRRRDVGAALSLAGELLLGLGVDPPQRQLVVRARDLPRQLHLPRHNLRKKRTGVSAEYLAIVLDARVCLANRGA